MALMSCPECGGKMSDKAPKCPHCGAVAAAMRKEKSTVSCSECGNILPENAAACPVCGSPVGETAPAPRKTTVQPAPYIRSNEGEQLEIVLIRGKHRSPRKIVCSVIAGVLLLLCAAAAGCFIYDFSFADRLCEFYSGRYYSGLVGGTCSVAQLAIFLAAAVVFAIIGAIVFIAGLGQRLTVTNAKIIIKRPFKPSIRLTWDRVSSADMTTDTILCVCAEGKKYYFSDLANRGEVHRVITDMLSRKSAGTLKMPTVCGFKSVFMRLLHKKAALTVAAAAAAVLIAAALSPLVMGLCAKNVKDVPYEWSVITLQMGGGLSSGVTNIAEITIKGTYTGKWLNGKPYGTGTIVFDGESCGFFSNADTYTGTWKNGEPSKGSLMYGSYERYSGGFRHSRMHGYGKFTNISGEITEGRFEYGHFPD